MHIGDMPSLSLFPCSLLPPPLLLPAICSAYHTEYIWPYFCSRHLCQTIRLSVSLSLSFFHSHGAVQFVQPTHFEPLRHIRQIYVIWHRLFRLMWANSFFFKITTNNWVQFTAFRTLPSRPFTIFASITLSHSCVVLTVCTVRCSLNWILCGIW